MDELGEYTTTFDSFIGEATAKLVTNDFSVFCTWTFDDEAEARMGTKRHYPSLKGKLVNQGAKDKLRAAAEQAIHEARAVFLIGTMPAECERYLEIYKKKKENSE